jgi:hypothetical protein
MFEPLGMEQIEAELTGMAKGGVAKVMAQGNGLGQVFIKLQTDGNGTGNLGNLENVGQASAVMVPGRGQKHLGFMFEATKAFGMNNPVAVALKNRTQITGVRLIVQAPPGVHTQEGMGRKNRPLLFFKLTTYGQTHGPFLFTQQKITKYSDNNLCAICSS